jgi:hypothetical protein
VLGQALDAPAGRRLEARVDAADLEPRGPVLGFDEALDELALVARGQQEPRQALGGVDAHHVPDDRPAADLDERLGDRLGVLL